MKAQLAVGWKKRGFVGFVIFIAFFGMSSEVHSGQNPQQSEGERLVREKQCLQCHKPNSSLNAPRLHGASREYLYNQLKAFQEGRRTNIFMKGVAAGLKDEDMQELASYFSGFNRCDVDMHANYAAGDVKLGEVKSKVCLACHTVNSTIGAPLLDGQNPFYLARQLRDLKYGRRQNPYMSELVKTLTEQDIDDVAAFFGTQENCERVRATAAEASKSVTIRLSATVVRQVEEVAKKKGIEPSRLFQQIVNEGVSQLSN